MNNDYYWGLNVGDAVKVHARINGKSEPVRDGVVVKASRYVVSVCYPKEWKGRKIRRVYRRRDGCEVGSDTFHRDSAIWNFWITVAPDAPVTA